MFQRLIQSFGRPANNFSRDLHDPELQLASTLLLFAMLPADYRVKQLECVALMHALSRLFGIGEIKSHRLIARAVAAFNKEPGIFASAMLLKQRTSPEFRSRLFCEARQIAMADGEIHWNEKDLLNRLQHMLGLHEYKLSA